jgi:NADH-quinone oxidoreductase subunit E
MSMFSLPEDLMPDARTFEAMKGGVPADMAGVISLFAHPVAASALGVGLVGQAFGFWLGAVSAMTEASHRAFASWLDEVSGEARTARRQSPATRARSTAKVLIEDARSTALEIVGGVARAERAVPASAPAELLPEDFRQPEAMPKPRKADDLKAISGIGPKLEKVLHGLGVWTYAQIAVWSREEIAWVDDYLSFKGRIGRDDWIGQAARLAGKRGGGKP